MVEQNYVFWYENHKNGVGIKKGNHLWFPF